MFDTSECIKEVVNPPPGSPDDITVEDHSRRREASFDISSRFRPRTGGFYSGLTAEVTAIEMEDLSRHHDTSTKHTAVSTPPVSLTDLTKVGQQEEESIKAETVRDRVAVAVEPQQFDLRVDVHKNATAAQGKIREEQGGQDENHRRFSNLSNLAQSLPSTSSSASALVPTVSGSFDYLTSDNNRRGREKREKRQKSESVRRTQSALNNTSARLKSKGIEEAANANVEEEQPLLMKRHQSLEEHRRSSAASRPTINLSSRSLDRCLEEKKKAVNTKVAKVKEEADFQTELEEATQALLIASQCNIYS